ncbi:hypothetical protein [Pseudomonas sp. NUPR-001]|uniref:hypothetical protein n=1 Tax=Pseudomonas sp. NUPR-001 TaxID=3416058 RepID=UPI003F98D0E1
MSAHRFSVVLSGNCLLLLSAELEEGQRRDVLDAHLFAWLNASSEFWLLGENEQWHGTYMDRHTELGWVISTFAHKRMCDRALVANTALDIAWNELATLVPAALLPALYDSRRMLEALPPLHPALQLLNTEALESAKCAEGEHIDRLAFEVRVVLPGLRVLVSSLSLETCQSLSGQWMTQTLHAEAIKRLVTRRFAGDLFEGVFAGLRGILQERLEPLRSTYLVPVNAASKADYKFK